jgi:hypothetical protein
MATDKPLPDTDDDIIDLTDLVEAGTADNDAAGDNGVDMSFEQELDDLFGDAEPMPAKSAPAAKAAPKDDADADDLFDLAGFEVADADHAATAAADADADDDVMDLSGFGLDEPDSAGPDDELAAPGFDDAKPAPPAKTAVSGLADDEAMDIADGSFDDLGLDNTAPAKDAADDLDDLDFGDFEEKPAVAVPARKAAPRDTQGFDAPDSPEPQTPEALAAVLTGTDDSTQTASDADLDAILGEPDAAMPDLLGELPDSPDADLTDRTGPTETADISFVPEDEPATAAADNALPAAAVAAAVPLAALAMAATAQTDSGPCVGGIDLGALDTLIDASKAPQPQADGQPAPETALARRLDALEAAAADLGKRLDALPEAPDENTLAVALASRLEGALALRLETMLAGHSSPPDLDGLKAGILTELQDTLADHLKALRSELPTAGELARNDDVTQALDSLREAVTRLEALTQGRHVQFEDFAQTMETRLAELRRELPDPDDFVTAKRLTEALDALGVALADDLTNRLQASNSSLELLAGRLEALEGDRIDPETLAEKLRATLADELADSLDERLQQAATATRDEIESLGEALTGRLETLETDRIDPEALVDKLRATLLADAADPQQLQAAAETAAQAKADAQKALAGLETRLTPGDLDAALGTLRTELTAEMERAVPKAAATVIREEIAALLKEFEG